MEINQKQKPTIIKLIIASVISIGMITALSIPFGMIPPLGNFLFPGDGIWDVPKEVPEYEILEDPNLSNDVEVYRDEWGIPHIYGYGEEDLMFALGYVQAQDRMIQMDLARRMARGRMSEIVGPDMLNDDKFNILKLEEYWANETIEYLQSEALVDPKFGSIYQMLIRFADGINKYIETNQNKKPFEYQFLDVEIAPWELVDTLVFSKYMSEYFTWSYKDMQKYENMMILGNESYNEIYGFPAHYQIPVCPNYGEYADISVPSSEFNPPSSSGNTDEIKTQPDSSENSDLQSMNFISSFLDGLQEFPQEVERMEQELIIGSNNWVISGNKTASGKPLLSTDMHLGLTLPGMWYEAHLIDISPGADLNLYAVFVPGVPLPIAGHTEFVGWGESIAAFDLIDWYYYNGINDTHYDYKGEPKAYDIMVESIPIKGQDPEEYIVKSTVHGPVFTDLVPMSEDFSDNVIACRWTSYNITLDFLALYGFMHAKDVYEFDEAIRYMDLLPLNIAFGDVEGNIGIRTNAKVPIRNDTDIPSWHTGGGDMPYNGSKGEGEWIDYLDFDDRPYCINPEQGFLSSANQYVAGPDYPNISVINDGGSAGYRARRINNLLAQNNDFLTVEDMEDMVTDIYSVRAGNFTPYLLNVLDTLPSKNNIQLAAYNELQNWDYTMDKDLVAPALFYVWAEAFLELTFQDEKDDIGQFSRPSDTFLEYLTKEEPDSKWFDNISTPEIENRDDMILDTFNIVLAGLEEYYETNNVSEWKWGVVHQILPNHLMNIPGLGVGPYPVSGSPYTINPSYGYNFNNGNVSTGYSRSVASERILVDFGNMNNSVSIIPSGERGISSSVHYTDQLEMFLRDEFHPQYFHATDPETLQEWANIESILIFKKVEN